MSNGLSEIQHFIAEIPPFNELPKEIITQLSQSINISYLRKESLLHENQTQAML